MKRGGDPQITTIGQCNDLRKEKLFAVKSNVATKVRCSTNYSVRFGNQTRTLK